MAYATTPPPNSPGAMLAAGQSVFPVMPAGGPGAGAARQMIVTGATGIEATPAGGDLFFAPAGGVPAIRDNVQVVTFSTTGDPAAAGGAPIEKRIIAVPAQPATPAPKP
jgi:hypothetical protein